MIHPLLPGRPRSPARSVAGVPATGTFRPTPPFPLFRRHRIRALLSVAGWSHVLRLAWPKVGYPAVRPALLEAAWASGGVAAPDATAGAGADPSPERAALALWDGVMADGKPTPKAGE